MMICHLPCKFGHKDIAAAIDSVGFGGVYDFLYLPYHARKAKGNIGYAFIHFKQLDDATDFAQAFAGYQFPGTTSKKQITVKFAHLQGYNAANEFWNCVGKSRQ